MTKWKGEGWRKRMKKGVGHEGERGGGKKLGRKEEEREKIRNEEEEGKGGEGIEEEEGEGVLGEGRGWRRESERMGGSQSVV